MIVMILGIGLIAMLLVEILSPSTLKTIADFGSLIALAIALALFLIQPRVVKDSTRRSVRRAVVVALILAIAGHAGGVFVLGPLAVEYEERQTVLQATIRSATVLVALLVECEKSFEDTYQVDIRCGFDKGDAPTLSMLATQLISLPHGSKRSQLTFSAEFDKTVDALPSSIGGLADSDHFFVTMGDEMIPEGAYLVAGTAVLTLNGLLQLEVTIPRQRIHDSKLYVRDLRKSLRFLFDT